MIIDIDNKPKGYKSYSSVDTFSQCRAKYNQQYNLQMRPIVDNRTQLVRGNLGHEIMAEMFTLKFNTRIHATEGDDYSMFNMVTARMHNKYHPSDEEGASLTESDFNDVVKACFNTLFYDGVFERYTPMESKIEGLPLIETEFKISINGYNMQGVIDMVAYDHKSEQPVIVDFKFRSRTSGEENPLNMQYPLYLLMAREAGFNDINIVNIVEIKSTGRTEFSVNKDGTVSRRVVACYPQDYVVFLAQHNQNVADYSDVIAKMDEMNFHQSDVNIVVYTNEQLEYVRYWYEQQVQAITTESLWLPSFGYQCKQCHFANYCASRMAGDNHQDAMAQSGFYTLTI